MEVALTSSIITSILSSAVGFLCGIARDSAADKLKDGDLADEKLREIIVKDLTDIKSKLDCLSLKDLDASYSFLKEGVDLLNLALEKSNDNQKASEGSPDEATRVMNDTASGILNAALSLPQAIQKLKISSDKRFISAQDCFKASREKATEAFNNKSLSIKDRIMACKLRVAARILELGLEDPEAATTACLSALKELHGLPAIQEMFAVFLKRGLKSMLKKAERLDNIMSVLSINHALYDFASKYSSESRYLFTWPEIELTDRTFRPILDAHEILTKTSTGEEFAQQLNRVKNRVVVDSRICNAVEFAVNSRGEIILLTDDKITVIYSTGESKDVVFPNETKTKEKFIVRGMSIAVDSNDNVYAIRQLSEYGSIFKLKLYAFDENYNIKHVSSFLDLPAASYRGGNIAVDKNQNLIMITVLNNQVCVCDNLGNLKFQFERDGSWLRGLSISKNNDIMIASDDQRAVLTYSTEGNLKSTIKLPEGHEVWQVAFHHGICKIIVLTYVEKEDSWFLLGYSETGELENSVFFCKRDIYWQNIDMKSHPSGPIAVRFLNSMTFI